MQEKILEIKNLNAGYNKETNIIEDINIYLKKNEIVSIIGPNGSGKSTCMKSIFGFTNINTGQINLYKGSKKSSLHQLSSSKIKALGVSYVPQVENIFTELTVHDNLLMGAFLYKDSKHELNRRLDKIYSLFPALVKKKNTMAGSLSGGERQMVAMGIALILEPEVLLLDEPTAGLSPKYMGIIFQIICDIKTKGVSVLLVEQHAKQAMEFSDRGYILALGKNAHEGDAASLLDRKDIAKLFFGSK